MLAKHEREGRAEMTLKKNRWLLEPVLDTFGDRPVGEVTAPELLHSFRKFEVRGRYECARWMRTVSGMVFRYAIATVRVTRDISLDLRGALTMPKTKHRAAIIKPLEVGALLRSIDGYAGSLRSALRCNSRPSCLYFLIEGSRLQFGISRVSVRVQRSKRYFLQYYGRRRRPHGRGARWRQ